MCLLHYRLFAGKALTMLEFCINHNTVLQELRISDINAFVFTETHTKIIKSKTRTFELKRTD